MKILSNKEYEKLKQDLYVSEKKYQSVKDMMNAMKNFLKIEGYKNFEFFVDFGPLFYREDGSTDFMNIITFTAEKEEK